MRRRLGLLLVLILLFGIAADANFCPDGCMVPAHSPSGSPATSCVSCGFAAVYEVIVVAPALMMLSDALTPTTSTDVQPGIVPTPFHPPKRA